MKEKEINEGFTKIKKEFEASIANLGMTEEQKQAAIKILESNITIKLAKKLKGDKKGIIKNRSQIRKEAQEEKRKEKKANKSLIIKP